MATKKLSDAENALKESYTIFQSALAVKKISNEDKVHIMSQLGYLLATGEWNQAEVGPQLADACTQFKNALNLKGISDTAKAMVQFQVSIFGCK